MSTHTSVFYMTTLKNTQANNSKFNRSGSSDLALTPDDSLMIQTNDNVESNLAVNNLYSKDADSGLGSDPKSKSDTYESSLEEDANRSKVNEAGEVGSESSKVDSDEIDKDLLESIRRITELAEEENENVGFGIGNSILDQKISSDAEAEGQGSKSVFASLLALAVVLFLCILTASYFLLKNIREFEDQNGLQVNVHEAV